MDLRDELQGATGELQAAVDAFLSSEQDGSIAHKRRRQNIISVAEKIISAVKEPSSQWMDFTLQSALIGATHLFQEWRAFQEIPDEGSITFAELGKKLNAEASVLERVGGVLVSMGVLRLVGTDSFAHTPKSRIFLDGNPSGMVYQLAWENSLISYVHMPEFFEKYGRKEPQSMNHIPITFAVGQPEMNFYEMIAKDPVRLQRFFKCMEAIEAKVPVAGIYDFGWLVGKAKEEPERTVFVDVGGGKGHAMAAIHQEFPDLPLDRFVLQDRLEVIEAVKATDDASMTKIQKMVINFHEAQPVKGAMVYWIRRCLHNYSDTVISNILRILAEAMADDSRILIQEDIKTNPCEPGAAVMDFMMLGFGGKSRTRRCWDEVLAGAGLKISGVSSGMGPWHALSVIECVKA